MSWTEQCLETNRCKFKEVEEVKEVLSTMGFDVCQQGNEIFFFGDENVFIKISRGITLIFCIIMKCKRIFKVYQFNFLKFHYFFLIC